MDNCTPQCRAMKLLVFGLVIVLVRYFYPGWDIWMVVGVLLVIKALMLFIWPTCCCHPEKKKK